VPGQHHLNPRLERAIPLGLEARPLQALANHLPVAAKGKEARAGFLKLFAILSVIEDVILGLVVIDGMNAARLTAREVLASKEAPPAWSLERRGNSFRFLKSGHPSAPCPMPRSPSRGIGKPFDHFGPTLAKYFRRESNTFREHADCFGVPASHI
jgi:hypothetical protein